MENTITDAEMADMNYQVEAQGKGPEDVAKAFLQEKGLLKSNTQPRTVEAQI